MTFDAGPLATAYVRETDLEWSLLIDEERTLYQSYGLDRGDFRNTDGPAAVWSYEKLLSRGRRLRLPASDVRQLGGDVLIDADGIVQIHHVGSGPADRPEISVLLEPVQR